MMHFFEYDIDQSMLIVTLLISVYVGMCSVMYSYLLIKRKNGQKNRDETFKILSDGFNSEVKIDEFDIRLIYQKKGQRFCSSYASFIEMYILYLRNGHTADLQNFEEVNNFLKGIVEREHLSRPYDGIDESERRILLSIEDAVQEEGIKKVVHNSLNDLSQSISNTECKLKRADRINAWTIPISVIGVILTCISLFFGSGMSPKQYDKFDEHMVTVIRKAIPSTLNNADSVEIADTLSLKSTL